MSKLKIQWKVSNGPGGTVHWDLLVNGENITSGTCDRDNFKDEQQFILEYYGYV